MDTQAMQDKGLNDTTIINPNTIYPPMEVKKIDLINPELKRELKQLIHEVLNDRSYHNIRR